MEPEEVVVLVERMGRHTLAPAIVSKAAEEEDHDDLAEIAAAVEQTVREESLERDVGRHGGIAVLYMVIDRLAELDQEDEDDET